MTDTPALRGAYYIGERATLFLGDCREVVPGLPRYSADLVVADPPYGVGWRSNHRNELFDLMAGDDGSVEWPMVLGEIVRHVLKPKRHVYVFGYSPDVLQRPLQLGSAVDLVWDKVLLGMGDLAQPWAPSHERLTFGTVAHRPHRVGRDGALSARLRRGSVVRSRRPNADAIRHPDEKPVELLRQLVESSTCLGEVVFDPTCGVGSSLVAAVLEGRRAIGIEVDERYLSIAVDRVREAERLAKLAEVA